MKIIQITPGAGAMYCGNCLRDNALVHTYRRLGHEVLMVPLYLPLTLDEADETQGTPIFFSGISVYLEQKSAVFRHAPEWFHKLLASRRLLKWAAGKTAKTRAEDLGELTLSMLKGEDGHQAQELAKLIEFLKTQPRADVICLSNLLLTGLVRRLKAELGAKVVCFMQGEDSFLDSLPLSHRADCWRRVAVNAGEADGLLSTSRYYAGLMEERLGIPQTRMRVVYSGINLDGFDGDVAGSHAPTVGFFARMCLEKGLDTLVEAFINLRGKGTIPGLRLRVGGSCGPTDQAVVETLKSRLDKAGLLSEVEFFPNVTREQKISLLKSLDVFSVPARYGEAFGLYLIEAMAAGVPVVQPRAAAFPELIDATGGGLLCEPESPRSLASELERVLLDKELALKLGEAGKRSSHEKFSSEAAAKATLAAFAEITGH